MFLLVLEVCTPYALYINFPLRTIYLSSEINSSIPGTLAANNSFKRLISFSSFEVGGTSKYLNRSIWSQVVYYSSIPDSTFWVSSYTILAKNLAIINGYFTFPNLTNSANLASLLSLPVELVFVNKSVAYSDWDLSKHCLEQ